MLPTRVLLNSAKKATGPKFPVELTPLFLAVCVAVGSGCFFTYKKLTTDDTLRLKNNPENTGLKEILNQK
ncbi:similar to Saccharomyces cerevisiae YPR010C-A Putative protein of unknown function [Maudiozyma saulgeensis]|uniref:Uncharacterized protein n=1 Tax=Maudiozyma saulgeensis TaxID=1789683 RepID=A0A1X7R0Q6_9SACH|nr:similar to Saccharomyces cerevisiae YPR010C-A Putative protein of unknown function [Kazachstania saulgeensis]